MDGGGDQPPPGPDISIAKRMLGPVITGFIITVSLATLRLYTRMTRKQTLDTRFKFSWDDITLLLATIASILQFAFLFAALPHGVGRHNYYIPYEDQVLANKFLLFSQIPWGWSVAFAKISIACLLLRLKNAASEGLWPGRFSLYALIGISIASAISANVVQVMQCTPIAAIWDPSIPGARCISPTIPHISIYTNGVVAVVSDIFLAATPISFLKNVRRSVRERAILIFLMGLGVFTAIATIVKLNLVEPYGKFGDGLWDTIDIVTWSNIEAYMGIIAASVPCLKSPFEKFLRRVGVIKTRSITGGSDGSEESGNYDPGYYDVTGSDRSSRKNSHIHDRNYRLNSILTGDGVGGRMRDVLASPTAASSEQSILTHGISRGREDV